MKNFDYRPTPFYFLNDRLDEKELYEQIKCMSENNVAGFFMHPRCGNLEQPYAGKEWFDKIGYIIKTAKKFGLKVWLYDEDPFPSGIAGGKVVMDHPEFKAQSLKTVCLKPDENGKVEYIFGNAKIQNVYALKLNEKNEVIEKKDITEYCGMVKRDWHKFMQDSTYYCDVIYIVPYMHWRSDTFLPEIMLSVKLDDPDCIVVASYVQEHKTRDKFYCLPCNINKKCVDYFIELTHEKYASLFGEEFGKTVKGVFTDEPVAGGYHTWYDGFAKDFYRLKGYDIKENYFYMNDYYGEKSRKVRRDYWQVVEYLYTHNYYKNLQSWCRKNNLALTGHIVCEEDPVDQTVAGGNVYQGLQYFDIPGFDIVGNLIGNHDHIALAFGAKLVSSVAHQKGKKEVMCECFACNPFNFGYDSMERIANWLFVLGITWLVPHGFFYAYGGMRKFDAGKSFFFQDPYFDKYPGFADYASRTGSFLSQFNDTSEICMLYPSYEFYSYGTCEYSKMIDLRTKMFDLTRYMLENHIEFDVTDCTQLLKSKSKNGKLKVGKKEYSSIIIPTHDINLLSDITEKLEKDKINYIIYSDSADLGKVGNIAEKTVIESEKGLSESIFCSVKKKGKDTLYYLFNNNKSCNIFSLKVAENKHYYVYDAKSDKYEKLDICDGKVKITQKGFESTFVLCTESEKKADSTYIRTPSEDVEFEYETSPEWEYVPPFPVNCTITHYDVKVEKDGKLSEYNNVAYARLRDYHCTEDLALIDPMRVPGLDYAPRRERIYPVNAVYTAKFHTEKGTRLLFEEDTILGKAKVFLNGCELKNFEYKKYYDYKNIVSDVEFLIKEGENELKFVFEDADEYSGINSAIYVID